MNFILKRNATFLLSKIFSFFWIITSCVINSKTWNKHGVADRTYKNSLWNQISPCKNLTKKKKRFWSIFQTLLQITSNARISSSNLSVFHSSNLPIFRTSDATSLSSNTLTLTLTLLCITNQTRGKEETSEEEENDNITHIGRRAGYWRSWV